MFRTPVSLTSLPDPIRLKDHLLCIGSCFAQAMGRRFDENKFVVRANPFGIVYNPVSVCQLLQSTLQDKLPPASTYLERDGLHFNYLFHSDFHATTQQELQTQIAQTMADTREFLRTAQWLVITLGTAFYYGHTATQQVVANCHKMPARTFEKRRLEPSEIVEAFEELFSVAQVYNPNLRYLFTVSPVRHVRDTLEQNSVSKAALRLAVDHLQRQHPDKVHYFPSYEIMLDDLRDYRFYTADMLHPSEVAEDYIWDKLVHSCLAPEAVDFLQQWQPIQRAMQHRAFHPTSAAHQQFLRQTLQQLKQLGDKVDVHSEIQHLEQQLV